MATGECNTDPNRGRGLTHHRIENDFHYHAPQPEMVPKFKDIRDKARELAHMMNDLCPQGRELSSALTRLEEVVFHANAAIAREAPVVPD